MSTKHHEIHGTLVHWLVGLSKHLHWIILLCDVMLPFIMWLPSLSATNDPIPVSPVSACSFKVLLMYVHTSYTTVTFTIFLVPTIIPISVLNLHSMNATDALPLIKSHDTLPSQFLQVEEGKLSCILWSWFFFGTLVYRDKHQSLFKKLKGLFFTNHKAKLYGCI